ncbi:MAG: SnoaL-like domain-containing protein [Saprospiraceae bacterium]|nr:SnoaL-like domain-containing protein [Saprospiraceae bacterium]
MKNIAIVLILGFVSVTCWAQIKVNSPYKQKDKTYIPDGDEPTPMPSDRKTESQTGSQPTQASTYMDDEAEVNKVIRSLFAAMQAGDVHAIIQLFASEGRLITTESNGVMTTMSAADFAKMIGGSQKGSFREEIRDTEIKIDDYLATAWVEYDFYLNGKFHHCGVDAFQLHRQGTLWRITQISDTRREDCSAGGEEAVINKVMDSWHAAASSADIDTYFDRFGNDAVFLGTDPTENWTKSEFHRFAKPYFNKGQVWDFKPLDRNVFFDEEGNISWFNELLDTWMGKCRGSGVLKKSSTGKWELAQYNLAILVPNDKVSEYLKLVGKR